MAALHLRRARFLLARFKSTAPRGVDVIGAPLCAGQPHAGVGSGPAALRGHGLLPQLAALGLDVADKGDVCSADVPAQLPPAGPGGLRHSAFIAAASQAIAHAVQDSMGRQRLSLLLGGDHTVGLGSVAGALRARPDTRVLWVDARA